MKNRGPSSFNTRSYERLEAKTSRGHAAGMGTHPPAARLTGARVRPDGNQPGRLPGASLLDTIPDRQRHHQAPVATAEAARDRRIGGDADSGTHLILAYAITFQGRPASDH